MVAAVGAGVAAVTAVDVAGDCWGRSCCYDVDVVVDVDAVVPDVVVEPQLLLLLLLPVGTHTTNRNTHCPQTEHRARPCSY